jgi:hypothetical protein
MFHMSAAAFALDEELLVAFHRRVPAMIEAQLV